MRIHLRSFNMWELYLRLKAACRCGKLRFPREALERLRREIISFRDVCVYQPKALPTFVPFKLRLRSGGIDGALNRNGKSR
jgi:hypothetical protein